jgi:glycerol-1-phosphatase
MKGSAHMSEGPRGWQDSPQAKTGAGTGEPAPAPAGCPVPLSTVYDVALLDLDGVVYRSGAAIPGAGEALNGAASAGMRLAFVTNNAYRTPAAIAAQLTGLGVAAAPEDVVTSAQAAARLLAGRLAPGSAVLVIGGAGLRTAVRERGMRPVTVAAARPAAVVQGYSPDVTYSDLAEGALAVESGALFVATNGDVTLPTPRGRQPGNGSLARVIATATGTEPLIAGKPEPALLAESVQRTDAKRPLVVGDRLDTDIEGACRVGADSMLVLTGVSGPLDAVLAPHGRRPSYLAEDVSGLLHPHPEVAAGDGAYRCQGWTARWAADGSELDLQGSGDRIDGLRALCAAAWSAGTVTRGAAGRAASLLEARLA